MIKGGFLPCNQMFGYLDVIADCAGTSRETNGVEALFISNVEGLNAFTSSYIPSCLNQQALHIGDDVNLPAGVQFETAIGSVRCGVYRGCQFAIVKQHNNFVTASRYLLCLVSRSTQTDANNTGLWATPIAAIYCIRSRPLSSSHVQAISNFLLQFISLTFSIVSRHSCFIGGDHLSKHIRALSTF